MFVILAIVIWGLVVMVFAFYKKGDKLAQYLPWLWKHIGQPLFNYLFVTSIRKVTVVYFGFMGSISISIPIRRVIFYFTHEKTQLQTLLEFDNSILDLTTIILGVLGTLSYFVFIIYEMRKLKTEVDRGTLSDIVEEVTTQVGRGSTDIVKNMLPSLKTNIEKLHIRTALELLETIRKDIASYRMPDWNLLSKIDYMIGMCAKYADGEKCKESLVKAYDEMEKSGRFDNDIVSGRIYVYCKDKDVEKAKELAKELHERDTLQIWASIPNLLFTGDLDRNLASISAPNKDYILATIMELGYNEALNHIDVVNHLIPNLNEITLENFRLWPFYLSILLTRFVRVWNYQPWGMAPKKMKESEDIFNLSERYYSCLATTQLGNKLPDLDFVHAFVAYNHDRSPLWLKKMTEFKYSPKQKEFYYLAFASMYIDAGKKQEATNLLKNYGEDANSTILHCRLHLAIQETNIPEIESIFKFSVEHNIELPNEQLNYYCTSIQICPDKLEGYISRLNITDIVSKHLLIEICNHYLNKNVDIDFIENNERKIHSIFIPYVAMIYRRKGKTDEAIKLIEPILPNEYYDIRNHVYIELLKSDKKYSSKLFKYLKLLRENGLATDDLLQQELHMAEKMMEFDRCLILTTLLSKKYPENGPILEHHIMALYRNGKVEDIVAICPTLKKLDFPESSVLNIFNILLISSLPEKAVAFLYDEMQKKHSQQLRDFFYEIHLNKDIEAIVTKQYDVVADDSYVCIDVNGREEYSEIRLGSHLDELIGKHVGDEIEIELLQKSMKVQIKIIFNKYFKLLREIMDDIVKNRSKQIRSLTIDDLTSGEGLLVNMKKLTGHNDEYVSILEETKKAYHKGQTTLYNFVNKHHVFSDLFNVLFGDFIVYTRPTPYISRLVQLTGVDVIQKTPVLELSGLLMVHELQLKFNLSFDKKFVIARALQVAIQDGISKEKVALPSGLETTAVDNMTFCWDENNDSFVLRKLRMLDTWVNEFCEIEYDENILDHDIGSFDNDMAVLHLQSTILANRPDRILLTEDWVTGNIDFRAYQAMSVANWLYLMGYDNYQNIQSYLADCNYVGCMIDAEYICEQYDKQRAKDKNHYNTCLANIEENALLNSEVLKASNRILSGIITPADTVSVTHLLIYMFKTLSYQDASNLLNVAIRAYPDHIFKQCLMNAYRIAHPLIW